MKVGDLVMTTNRKSYGIVLKVDWTKTVGRVLFPYFISFSDGETDWMRGYFLEVISESR